MGPGAAHRYPAAIVRRIRRQARASGFFALRTPLLPFDALLEWGADLEAPTATADSLPKALARDVERLRARLHAIVARPEVREALFLASPDLSAALPIWQAEPDSSRGARVERGLVRYVSRMAGRATPFGLFAGNSTGTVGASTELRLEPLSRYRRHTRLDMGYLCSLTEILE